MLDIVVSRCQETRTGVFSQVYCLKGLATLILSGQAAVTDAIAIRAANVRFLDQGKSVDI